jgi:hypothetical protein
MLYWRRVLVVLQSRARTLLQSQRPQLRHPSQLRGLERRLPSRLSPLPQATSIGIEFKATHQPPVSEKQRQAGPFDFADINNNRLIYD